MPKIITTINIHLEEVQVSYAEAAVTILDVATKGIPVQRV